MTLYGNPICVRPNLEAKENVIFSSIKFNSSLENLFSSFFLLKDESYSYRYAVIKILPHVRLLDDEPTLGTKPLTSIRIKNPSERNNNYSSSNHKSLHQKNDREVECPFDDDWQLINELIDEGIGPPEEKLAINGTLYLFLLMMIMNFFI